jgi:hypothetical protein
MEVIKHEGFEEQTSIKALELLLIDRKNEFRELATIIGIPINEKCWEKIILNTTTMNELAHLENIAYTLAEEFKAVYTRLK